MRHSDWNTWLRVAFGTSSRKRKRAAATPTIAPRFEEMESRLTPAAPSVVSIARAAPPDSITSSSSIVYNVVFSKPVTGVDAADFTTPTTGNVTRSALQIGGSGANYTVSFNAVLGDGTIGLNLVDNNSIRDSAGVPLYSAGNPPSFPTMVTYSTGLGSFSIPVADLNNDGKLDFALGDEYGTGYVGWGLGNGDGTFQVTSFRTSLYAGVIQIGDVNNDSNQDLVFVDSGFNTLSGAAVMLGNGNGTFKAPSYFTLPTAVSWIDLKDIDKDGNLDVVQASTSGFVAVALGVGNGTFLPSATFATGQSEYLVVADINRDEKLDLVVANSGDGTIGLLLGNGNGTFQTQSTLAMGNVHAVAVADVNNDGFPDLAATNYGAFVKVWLGDGFGAFSSGTTFSSPGGTAGIQIADMTGDGKPDLVISKYTQSQVAVLTGNGNGTFAPETTFSTRFSASGRALTVADVNGDNRPDFLLQSPTNARYVTIRLNGNDGNFAGNVTSIDQTKPTTALTALPPAISLNTTATFNFTGSDPLANGIASGIQRFEFQLDGSSFTSATSPLVLSGLAEGGHTFNVRAVDLAGNIGLVAAYSWSVDTTAAPNVRSIARSAAATNSSNFTYIVDFNGLVAGVDATDFVVNKTGTVTGGSVSVSGSGDRYTVTVSGISGDGTVGLALVDDDSIIAAVNGLPLGGVGDGNGNFVGEITTIDRTAPSASINSQPPTRTTSSSASFSFTGADPLAGDVSTGVQRLEYRLDGGAYVPGVSPVSFANLTIATHTFEVRAVDAVGNIGLSANYTWTVDRTAPRVLSIERLSPSGSPASASSIAYTVTFSEPVTGVDAVDFQVVKSGALTTGAVQVTGSGASYTVTLADVVGNGSLGLNLADNNSIRDLAGQPLYSSNGSGGFGPAAFSPPTPYTSGLASITIPVADFNSDGKVDIVLIDKFSTSNNIGIILGNGDGTFKSPQRFTTLYGCDTVHTEDFNGDGKADLVVISRTSSLSGVGAVMLGNGNGTFQPLQTFSAEPNASVLAIGDLNGDGKPDLAVCGYGSPLSVLLGNGNGTFQPRTTYTNGRTSHVEIADVNNDGKLDVIAGNQRDNNISVFLNNGNGTLQARLTFALEFNAGFALADVDSDSKIDIVATTYDTTVFQFLGNGNGTFKAPTTYATSDSAVAVRLVDVNGDGMRDMIVGKGRGNTIDVRLGNANGVFGPVGSFATGSANWANSLNVVDVNGDGRPDALTQEWSGSRTFAVLLNTNNGNFTGATTAIDQSAPTAAITAGPLPVSLKTTATFAFTGADAAVSGIASGVQRFEYRLDGGAYATATSPVQLTGLTYAPHTFEVRAVDNAGNVGAPVAYSWVADDTSAPVLASIVRVTGTASNASSVSYTVTFNGAVIGVDAADFAAVGSGTLTAGPILVTGSGDVYTVSMTGIGGDGEVFLRLIDDDTIVADVNGLPLGGTGSGGGGDGSPYTIDRTAPTALFTAQPPLDTLSTSASFSFTGVDPTAGGVSTGINRYEYKLDNAAFVAGSGPVALTGLAIGSHTFQVRAIDNAGNVGVPTTYTWTVSLPPVVQSIVRGSPTTQATGALSVSYIVTFNRAVTGVDAADFKVAANGALTNASIDVSGSDAVYTVTVSGIRGVGDLRLDLVDNDSIVAGPFNFPLGGVGVANGSFQGPTYAVSLNSSMIAPSIQSFTRREPVAQLTAATSVVFNITFSEPVAGVDLNDFQLVVSGSAVGTLGPISPLDATSYSIAVTGISGIGQVGLNFIDDGSIQDANGNKLIGAGGQFTNQTTMAVGNTPTVVRSADLDGDGVIDLLVANSTNNGVGVLIGNGNGTFKPQTTFAAPQKVEYLIVADVNGDGAIDALTSDGTSSFLSILLGNGNGTFKSGITTAATTSIYTAVADLNADGKADLVAVSQGSASVSVKLGNGDGTFKNETTYAATAANGVAIADVDGDQIPDVVVGGATTRVFLGNGNGTLKTPLTFADAASNSVVLADFNGDQKLDFASANTSVSRVSVRLGNGNGTFLGATTYNVGTNPSNLVVADVDLDGKIDLLTANNTSSNVTLLLGSGNGLFQSQVNFDMGSRSRSIAVADLNGDGRPDFATANAYAQSVSVRLATTAIAGPAYSIDPPSPAAFPFVASIESTNNVVAGLIESTASGAFNETDAGTFQGVTTGFRMAQTTSGWATNTTYIYTGQIFDADGFIAFGEHFDDNIAVKVDGVLVLRNVTSVAPTTTGRIFIGLGPANDGWHKIEVRVGNGTGAGGPSATAVAAGWTSTKGFGINFNPPAGFNSVDGTSYVAAVDPGDRSLLRASATAGPAAAYTVTFSEAVTGVDGADFQVATTGSLVTTGILVVAVDAQTYQVTVSGITGNGIATLKLVDNGTIRDLDGQVLVVDSPAFAPQATFGVSVKAEDIAAADFNGDGFLDLVAGAGTSLGVSLLLGNGNGTFKPNAPISVPSVQVVHVQAADINGDGKPDLVLSAYLSDTMVVLLGAGDGTFPTRIDTAVGRPVEFTISDVNADGKKDLVVTRHMSSGAASILLGNGNGTFSIAPTVSLGAWPLGGGVGDFNSDGKLDYVATSKFDNQLSLALGNGDGTFKPRVVFSSGTQNYALNVADLNNDGKPDVAIANANGTVSVLLGNGNGTFVPTITYSTGGGSVFNLDIADINADGRLDLLFPNNASASGSILLGNGDATYLSPTTFALPGSPRRLIAADFNGDGRADLASANFDSPATVSVILAPNGSAAATGLVVDRAGPNASISVKPAAFTNATSASFTFAGTDPLTNGASSGVARLETRLDGGTFATSLSPQAFTGLTEGNHTFAVRAIDNLGNVGNATSYTWMIDQTIPTVTIASAPPPVTFGSASYTFSGIDPLGNGVASGIKVFEYRLDSGSFATAANPLNLTGLSDGAHTLTVRAVDNAGNVSDAITHTFVVELAPASVVSIARQTPSATAVNATSVAYTVTFSKPVTGVDAGDFSLALTNVTATAPIVVTPVSGSVYNVAINGIAGNGTIGLNLVDNSSIRDAAGNPLAPANAPAAFQPELVMGSGSLPSATLLTDLDLDGAIDLLVANTDDGTLSVFLGNGNGTFRDPETFDAGPRPESIAIGDVNGDGYLDAAIGNSAYSSGAVLLLGDGAGSFQSPTIVDAGATPYAVSLVDVTGDGILDLVAANHPLLQPGQDPPVPIGNRVTLLQGVGDGSFFLRQTIATGQSPNGLALGDLNGDGFVDLVVPNAADNSLSIYRGDGVFHLARTLSVGNRPVSAMLADLNADGKLDIVAANADSDSISVFLGNGDAALTFQAPQTFAAAATPVRIAVGDFNADSRPDLVVAHINGQLGVFLGNGNGTFRVPQAAGSGGPSNAVAVADFNGDARADVVVARMFDSTVGVLVNAVSGSLVGSTYTIDQTPPIVTINSQPAAIAKSTAASFSFTAVDSVVAGVASGVVRIEYRLDGGTFATTTGIRSFIGLGQGLHTFEVRAVDAVGNVGPIASVTWLVDTAAPVVTIASTPPAYTTSHSATFVVSATDSPGGVTASGLNRIEYQLDSGAYLTAAGPITFDNLDLGKHVLRVRAVDNAGNTGIPTQYSWTVVAPEVAVAVQINAGTAPIASYVVAGTTVTVTTAGATTFAVGQKVVIAGMANIANNGVFVVTSGSNDSTTFAFTNANLGAASANAGGTATVAGGIGSLGEGLAGSQQSMVDSITYTFSQPVVPAAGAFSIGVHSGSTGTIPTLAVASPDGGLTWIVTFRGNGVLGNSIADGIYDITLDADAVTTLPGSILAGDRTDTFARRFGDIDGSGAVTKTADRVSFTTALGSSTGDVSYLAAFDFNADGAIAIAPDRDELDARIAIDDPDLPPAAIVSAPTVTSLTSRIGPTTGGTLVTIRGANFVSISSVLFDGLDAATFTVLSTSEISAVTAAHGPGSVNVTVSNPGGSGTLAGSNNFTYSHPVVTAATVNGGPSTALGATGAVVSLAGQYSVVKQVVVTFNQAVTVASDAFTLTPRTANVTVRGGAAPSTAEIATSVTPLSPTSYLVTFSGPGTHDGGILNSGIYDLTTIASKVTANGDAMAANRIDSLFAMFGTIDSNNSYTAGTIGNGGSNAFVDPGSLFRFSDAFGSNAATPVGPPAYSVVFDSNLDGFIDPGDLFAFSDSFGIDWSF